MSYSSYITIASKYLKKVASGIQKNPGKYFSNGVHQKYGYERITEIIKSSLIGVYDRFPSQSFELLNGGESGPGPHNMSLKS